jgi:hypothetical protein
MEYFEEANKLVKELRKLHTSKNLRKLDYEMLKAKTVEMTNECQKQIEDEWIHDEVKKNWIGTPTEHQELARRLADNEEMTQDREALKELTRQELIQDLEIFEMQELLHNLRIFGGKR